MAAGIATVVDHGQAPEENRMALLFMSVCDFL